ncbi:hypothetical protein ACFVMC_04865 [Nocardia sp. NPDC127579]|uniref:hypothetical protein n=1 Tax=Nocardia sp. NPDC127579 TaxID=3345402 RepID=UPI0036362392
MKRAIVLGMLATAVTALGMGTASAKTIEAGTYSSRSACEQAGKAQLHGDVLSYRCSATSPIPGTNGYNYILRLEVEESRPNNNEPSRPCSPGTGSAAISC